MTRDDDRAVPPDTGPGLRRRRRLLADQWLKPESSIDRRPLCTRSAVEIVSHANESKKRKPFSGRTRSAPTRTRAEGAHSRVSFCVAIERDRKPEGLFE